MKGRRAALALVVLAAVGGLFLLGRAPDEAARPALGPSEPVATGTARPPAPPAAPGEPARVASARPTSDAAPAASAAATARRARLTGRLVAQRLEWGWVWALPAAADELAPPARGDEEEGDDGLDVRVDAEGVPTVDPWRSYGFEEAALGRPAGGWAVPLGATRVDPSGAFALDLAPGTWVVLAGARGCPTQVEALRLEVDHDVTWTLAYAPPATLDLTCLAAGGEPLAFGRIECDVTRDQVEPLLVTVGDGPWGPLDVEAHAARVDRTVTRALLRLDAEGRVRLELPAGRVVLSAGDEADHAGLDVGADDDDESPVRWRSVGLPYVVVTLGAGERRDLTLRQPEPEGGVVLVRVRDAAGLPVAGAQVGLAETDDGPVFELLQEDTAATTGPDGRATFLDHPLGALYAVARAGGRSGRSPPRLVQAAGERLEVEVVLDEVDPHGTLLVRVLAADTGAPLAGASVSLREPGASPLVLQRRVGPGLLRVDGAPLGRQRLAVVAEGRAAREVEVDVTGGAPSAVVVSLAPAAVVAGRVAGSAGDEQVWLLTRDDRLVAATRLDDGRFRFATGPAPGEELVVRVFGPARLPHDVPVRAPAELELTLPSERTPLQVLRADGSPGAGVTVYVRDADGEELATADTGPDGRVELRGRPPAGATVEAEGVARVPLAPDLVLRRVDARREPAPPAPTAFVSGSALDLAGRPAVGARVWVHEAHGTCWDTTDAAGAFRIQARVGPVEVLVERPDLGRWAERLELTPAGASVVARFRPSVAVRVRAPAPAVSNVSCTPDGGWGSDRLGRASGFRRADGTFDLGLLLPGRWRVVLRDAVWHELAAHTIEVAPPGPVVVTLE